MEYRSLGRTGVKIASLCLGTFNFGNPTPEDDAARMVGMALDAGINMLETADSCTAGESERMIGRILAANGRRSEVFLATKVFYAVGGGPNDAGVSRVMSFFSSSSE